MPQRFFGAVAGLMDDSQANVGNEIGGDGAQDAVENVYSAGIVALFQQRLAQRAVGVQEAWMLLQNVAAMGSRLSQPAVVDEGIDELQIVGQGNLSHILSLYLENAVVGAPQAQSGILQPGHTLPYGINVPPTPALCLPERTLSDLLQPLAKRGDDRNVYLMIMQSIMRVYGQYGK